MTDTVAVPEDELDFLLDFVESQLHTSEHPDPYNEAVDEKTRTLRDALEVTVDEEGRFDPDSEPSLSWLEQVSLDSPTLTTRTDPETGETRNFRVSVDEIGGDNDE